MCGISVALILRNGKGGIGVRFKGERQGKAGSCGESGLFRGLIFAGCASPDLFGFVAASADTFFFTAARSLGADARLVETATATGYERERAGRV